MAKKAGGQAARKKAAAKKKFDPVLSKDRCMSNASNTDVTPTAAGAAKKLAKDATPAKQQEVTKETVAAAAAAAVSDGAAATAAEASTSPNDSTEASTRASPVGSSPPSTSDDLNAMSAEVDIKRSQLFKKHSPTDSAGADLVSQLVSAPSGEGAAAREFDLKDVGGAQRKVSEKVSPSLKKEAPAAKKDTPKKAAAPPKEPKPETPKKSGAAAPTATTSVNEEKPAPSSGKKKKKTASPKKAASPPAKEDKAKPVETVTEAMLSNRGTNVISGDEYFKFKQQMASLKTQYGDIDKGEVKEPMGTDFVSCSGLTLQLQKTEKTFCSCSCVSVWQLQKRLDLAVAETEASLRVTAQTMCRSRPRQMRSFPKSRS